MKSSSRNLFTESEIQNASNMKSLFFEKWMRAADERPEGGDEVAHGSDESIHKDIRYILPQSSGDIDPEAHPELENSRTLRRKLFPGDGLVSM